MVVRSGDHKFSVGGESHADDKFRRLEGLKRRRGDEVGEDGTDFSEVRSDDSRPVHRSGKEVAWVERVEGEGEYGRSMGLQYPIDLASAPPIPLRTSPVS